MTAADHRRSYEQRVNRVIDHIHAHLADDLSLTTLAGLAAFSPFHFHRVFKGITGETLFAFIHRLRIEHAANALRVRRDESVLAVALDHGFSSAATFARAFKTHFGMSATEWRAGGAERWRRARRPESKEGKAIRKGGKARRSPGRDSARKRRQEDRMSVHVTEVPPQHVAYMRYVGPYGPHGIPDLWMRLRRWMEGRDLAMETTIRLGIAYDDPGITAAEKCRYDACVVVPPGFAADRWVNLMDVPGGKYAVAAFAGTASEIGAAWDTVFRSWLPGSGWDADDRPCFERYCGNPMIEGTPGTFRCELCLPVRPL